MTTKRLAYTSGFFKLLFKLVEYVFEVASFAEHSAYHELKQSVVYLPNCFLTPVVIVRVACTVD